MVPASLTYLKKITRATLFLIGFFTFVSCGGGSLQFDAAPEDPSASETDNLPNQPPDDTSESEAEPDNNPPPPAVDEPTEDDANESEDMPEESEPVASNNAPVFSGSTSYFITEGIRVVGRIRFSDADNGDVLTYSLSGGADQLHFSINAVTGRLTFTSTPIFAVPIDTNADGVYELEVSASDQQTSTSAALMITITPITIPGAPGEWTAVTPDTINLDDPLSCSNFGTKTVQSNPHRPQDMYTFFFCQGVYKSTDYGLTWTGPINTGENGNAINDCAGGITLGPTNDTTPPILYLSCIRGSALGFWRSIDGGVSWVNIVVTNTLETSSGQEFYPPVVDPYDSQHLLMAGHANNYLLESSNAGDSWRTITPDNGMLTDSGTGAPVFINTGSAEQTRRTWLWLSAQQGGSVGTWRTTNAGDTWVHVEKNEHINGALQVWQPGTNGEIFVPGAYSDLGPGVLYSDDYGVSWQHVGLQTDAAIVIGTSRNVYSMYGWAIGAGNLVNPSLQVSPLPGTGAWQRQDTPPEMTQGPAQAAVTNDGTNNIIVTASYNAGLWRYVEPQPDSQPQPEPEPEPNPGNLVESVSANDNVVQGSWRNITPKTINPLATPCTNLRFDPSNPSTLYAIFGNGGGLWKSVDAGKHWLQIGDLPEINGLGRIRIDPNNPKHMYVTGGVVGAWGFWVSNDGGNTWRMPAAFAEGANNIWTRDMYNIAVDPLDFNHFILSSHQPWAYCGEGRATGSCGVDAGVLESRDGGVTFIPHYPPDGMNHGNGIAILSDPRNSQGNGDTWLVGGGYDRGIYRTDDAGKTWTKVSNSQDSHGGFYATYSAQGNLYIGVNGGIDRSSDNGKTWTSISLGLGGWFYGLASDGEFLYTAPAFVGVQTNTPLLVSPEGGLREGEVWTNYNDENLLYGPFRMYVEPNGKTLYNSGWDLGAWALDL